ncbi:MAG: TIGR04222 domain-containing membrane protein [Hymenobacter sp.]|nr:MAG: TIGR04222 domain-containing membrane protein [Hymenobacter sp.]
MSTSNPPRFPAAQPALWARLLAFDLDGAAQFSFSKRLARDNGWPLALAQRVALEYKKFLYLAATCGHPVTPSDEVDQAWHLHLVYTRSYWDDLCGQVLGFALHHGPTKGGTAEGYKFRDWYAQTLRAYQAAFGTAAPVDIWPPAAQRFGEAPHFRRVNTRQYLLVPRPRWRWVAPDRRLGLAMLGALALAGCTARLPLNPFNWYGTDFLLLFWTLCLTLVPLALWMRHRGRGPEEPFLGSLPGTYELARLAENGRLLADSALAALAYTARVKLLPDQRVCRADQAAPPTDPYELAVWQLISHTGTDLAAIRERANSPTFEPVAKIDNKLLASGLLLAPATRQQLDKLPLFTILALGIFGAVKVVVGLNRDRPVGFLLFSLIALAIAGVYFYQRGAWATGRGAALLNIARLELRQPHTDALSTRSVALTAALFGIGQLGSIGLGNIGELLVPPRTSSSSSDGGGGSDGGGSGCGSGCGGCGGCGS